MIDLVSLADKYEVSSFCEGDPSYFLRWYPLSKKADVETASFIAAMLSFGSRKQFVPKIKLILETADKTSGSITKWICEGCPRFKNLTDGNSGGCRDGVSGSFNESDKFYRFYSYKDMADLFGALKNILTKEKTLGEYFRKEYEKTGNDLALIIGGAFKDAKIVPKGKNSANKRIHMFLRWMVRKNSPVDLGLWDWYGQEKLIIPLDVHVMQVAESLGFLDKKDKPSYKTAVKLTQKMEKYFPKDPARADFALFGSGVSDVMEN